MNKIKCIVLLVMFMLTSTISASSASSDKEKIDVKEIVLGHMSDAYDWHILTWNGHHVSIPLPVIVKGETTGWHVFSSSKLAHGHEYKGFYINHDKNGKIYEKLSDGSEARPWDI